MSSTLAITVPEATPTLTQARVSHERTMWEALSWASANTALRMALGFFSAKVSAVYLGPPGMALVGQISNFLQVTTGAIANGPSTAVVNLTAQHEASESLDRLWGTAMRLVLAISAIVALLAIAGAQPLSAWLFLSTTYWPVVVIAALAIVGSVADTVLVGALNGLKQVRLIASAGIAATVVEFGVFAGLTYSFGLWGGLAGMAIIYGTRLIVSATIAYRSGLMASPKLFAGFDRSIAREIAHFYPMLLANSIALPLAQILVRNAMIRGISLEQAGLLQATWRLSDMYVGVLTTALGLFFMAHFAALPDDRARGAMLRRTVLQMFAFTAVAALGVYFLKDVIIKLVLTRRFLPMRELLPFQLAGDVVRMILYPLQMALVSRRQVGAYVTQAVGGGAIYVVLTYLWRSALGVQAAPLAYGISNFVALIVCGVALRHLLGGHR
jgi:PST family polysaccharide transporter